jgi:hypothetical protein
MKEAAEALWSTPMPTRAALQEQVDALRGEVPFDQFKPEYDRTMGETLKVWNKRMQRVADGG